MAAPSTIRVIPWKPEYIEFFDLPAREWTPPAQIRTVANAARTRMTIEGIFTLPDGSEARVVSKNEKAADGEWYGVEERLHRRFVFRVGGGS